MTSTIIRRDSSETRIVIDNRDALDALVADAESAASESGSGSRWMFNDNWLRQIRSKHSLLESGATAQLAISIVGDSLTAGAYFIDEYTRDMQALDGSAGVGFFGVGWYDDGFGTKVYPGDAAAKYYAVYTGSWTNNYHAGSTSPSLSDTRSSSAGARIKVASEGGAVQPVLSAVKLHFTGTANGVVKWRWGGGAWSANTNVQGGVGVQQVLNLTGFPTVALTGSSPIDTNMVEIEVVSGSVILCGIDFQSAAAGVKVHKLGAAGATSANWVGADETALTAAWGFLDVDAVIILLGYNDGAASITPVDYNTNVAEMVDRMRAAHPACDVWLVAPPENQSAYPVAMADYADVLKGLALGSDYAVTDLQPLFGDAGDPAEYGVGGTVPLFLADATHPAPAGSAIIKWAFKTVSTVSVIGGAAVYDVEERALDAVGSALTGGAGIAITPNDPADTITIAATGNLALLAGLTAAADKLPYFTGGSAMATATFTAAGRALVDDADAAAQRTTLGLAIGTNVQAYDADLATWAGVTPGTGVTSALAIAVGSAGAFVTFNGALGTPSSGTLTNCTGLPLTTGVTGTLSVAKGGTGDTGTAWSTWTPTITSGGGAVTGATISATAKYKTLGKTVFWAISCTITSKGSGSPTGTIIFTTPGGLTSANATTAGAGFYINSGLALASFVSSDGHVYATKYEGSTLWADGNVFVLSGVYEAA